MEKEFVPYEIALKLKALGFDEPCFGYYVDGELRGINLGIEELGGIEPYYQRFGFHTLSNHDIDNPNKIVVTAPTFSQAFRWFREKYNLHPIVSFDKFIDEDDNDVELDEPYFTYYYSINELWDNTKDYNKFVRGFVNVSSSRGIVSHEEAELACLEKLIEIVESKSE